MHMWFHAQVAQKILNGIYINHEGTTAVFKLHDIIGTQLDLVF